MRYLPLAALPLLLASCAVGAQRDDDSTEWAESSGALETGLDGTLELDGEVAANVQIVSATDREIVVHAFSMGQPMRDWIQASLSKNYQRKNGELKAADFKREVSHIREFKDALITEIGFPAMDGSSKDPAYLTLKFAPEYTRYKKTSGATDAGVAALRQKTFHPTNFLFALDGLDSAACKVSKVDALTVKQSTTTDDIGDSRDYAKEPGKLEFPALKVTLEGACDSIDAWKAEGKEKNGTLVLLAADREPELLRINFFNMGIYSVTPDKSEANDDKIKRVTLLPSRLCLAPCE